MLNQFPLERAVLAWALLVLIFLLVLGVLRWLP